MSLYQASVPQFIRALENIGRWLDQAETYAEARKFDPHVLLAARLSPDMFPLTRQIQSACDGAKLTPARLTGQTAPSHADTETTLTELRARIASTVAYLQTFTEADFEGSETRVIAPPPLRGAWMPGADYLYEFGLPNFYFHATMAYAILRSQGVPLGKVAFLGPINARPPAA